MAKASKNSGKQWTDQEVRQLRQLAKEKTPTRMIGLKLGRAEDAICSKASEEKVSLKPTSSRRITGRRSSFECRSVAAVAEFGGISPGMLE